MDPIYAVSPNLVSSAGVEVMAIQAGGNGAIYVAGYFTGTLNGQAAAGGRDAFLARVDSGAISWIRPLGTTGDDHATSIAIDSLGNLLVAGTTGGGLSGETNSGVEDAFVAKFSPDGTRIWTQLLGGTTTEQAFSVSVGTNDSIYVAGTTYGSLPGATISGSLGGRPDSFIASYDTNGVRQSVARIGSTSGYDTLFATAVDNAGFVYLVGSTKGGGLFGQTSGGGADVYIAKYDQNLNLIWGKLFGSTAYDRGYAVDVAADGSIYLAGFASGSVDSQGYSGGVDSLLTKYDSAGNRVWTRLLGSAGDEYAFALKTNAPGDVFVAGTTSGNLDGNINQGGYDAFVSKFDASGAKLWTKSFGTANNDVVNGIALAGC